MNPNSLLRLEEYLAQQSWEKRDNTFIRQEETMFAHKLPSRFEWLEFAFQLCNTDHSGDELNILLLEEIFVLSLRVLCDEAYGRCAWIDGRVREGTEKSKIGEWLASAWVWSVEDAKSTQCMRTFDEV